MKYFYFDINCLSLYRAELMGFAIIWVILYHSGFAEPIPFVSYISSLYRGGFGGVDIFMMLSGFGLSFSMSKKKSLKAFYLSRVARIYPIYFILVFVGCLLNSSDGILTVLWKCTAFGYWTNGDYFDWYVPAILTMYALFPLIYRYVTKKNLVIGIMLFFSAFSIMHVFLPFSFLDWQHFLLVYRIPIFLYGSMLACSIINRNKMEYYLPISIVLLFIGFFFIFTFHILSYSITISFATPFIVAVLCKIFSVVKFNFLSVIGKASLEIYVIHVIILQNKYYLLLKEDNCNISTLLLLFVSVFGGILVSLCYEKIRSRVF